MSMEGIVNFANISMLMRKNHLAIIACGCVVLKVTIISNVQYVKKEKATRQSDLIKGKK